MNSSVNALAVSGSDLYAGGYFTTAGGSAANHIAKWNGSSWSALGSGMNIDGSVNALAISGSDLYAGGRFSTAGGSNALHIAKWDGSSWSALGSGMDDQVLALAVSGGDVYAGGSFTTAGGSTANRIAKWNGSSWSALGSGMDGSVFALAVSGSDLYAGGDFTTAGGKVSGYVAKAYLVAPPGGVADSIVASSSGAANVQFYGNPGHQFDVQRTTSLTPPVSWTTVTTSPLSPASGGAFTFVDTNAPDVTAYYRAVEH
jgi:hypothetical protein